MKIKTHMLNREEHESNELFTVLFTRTIESLRDPGCCALYVFMATMPSDWKLDIIYLNDHFKIGKDKIYKIIKKLCEMGLMEKKEIRDEKGRFKENEYYLYLEPIFKD